MQLSFSKQHHSCLANVSCGAMFFSRMLNSSAWDKSLGIQGFHQWLLVYCQLCTASVICKMVICGCGRDLSIGCLLGNFRDKCCWNDAAVPFAGGHRDLCGLPLLE